MKVSLTILMIGAEVLAGCVIAPGPAGTTPDGLVRRQSARVVSRYAAKVVSLAK